VPGPAAPITLTTPLSATGLITDRAASLLASLGIRSVGRLVAHLPARHVRIEAEAPICDLVPGSIGSARGEVTAVRPVRAKAPRLEAVVMDHTGRLDVVWFNALYLAQRVKPGVFVLVQGKVQKRGPQIQMVNPSVRYLGEDSEKPAAEGRLRPVYPASEAVSSSFIEKQVAVVLPHALPLLDDHLPPEFLREREMPALRDAYRMQHAPTDEEEVRHSRRRLAYDELLLLQLGVHMKRARLRLTLRAPALRADDALDGRIRARLPFPPTHGQERAIADLRRDLSQPTPANRLIQGDVGSGKTLVALYAMLMAVASGHQASLMAPTEVLAQQHAHTFRTLLAGSKVRVELLTGATPAGERAAILSGVVSGEVNILIGTHALLTEGVAFHSLALAIIDEQHRFGVHQRAQLRSRASDDTSTPHVVVMTATPIPRSLALTLFGDLDVSTIEGLPPGRSPIMTRAISSEQRRVAYEDLRARVDRGEQGFVVVPAVEGSDDASAPLVGIETALAALEQGVLAGKRVAPLHAQLPGPTREAVMERFRLGLIDALVCTTVIEVGVDVPNATVMIIEQADRFGLAQLHQLRGRVGRGGKPGACFLIADPTTEGGAARLAILETVTDGFVLAEKDLEQRGMGEIFGTRQSGLPPFRIADPVRDRDLLMLASRDAAAWIGRSPRLDRPEEAVLLRRLMKAHGEFLGLGDVG